MIRIQVRLPGPLAACLLAAGLVFAAQPAGADVLPSETFVSIVGDDANDCTAATPCASVSGAIAKTNPGGVVRLLNVPAPGQITIDRSITILGSDHVLRASPGSFTPAISIAAGSTGRVTLKGIILNNTAIGGPGIYVTSAANVLIEDCAINSASIGLFVTTLGQTVVMVKNTTFSRNDVAVKVDAGGTPVNRVLLDNVQIFDSQDTSLSANHANSNIVITRTTVAGSLVKDIAVTNGGTVTSYGNNVLRGAGNPTGLLALE